MNKTAIQKSYEGLNAKLRDAIAHAANPGVAVIDLAEVLFDVVNRLQDLDQKLEPEALGPEVEEAAARAAYAAWRVWIVECGYADHARPVLPTFGDMVNASPIALRLWVPCCELPPEKHHPDMVGYDALSPEKQAKYRVMGMAGAAVERARWRAATDGLAGGVRLPRPLVLAIEDFIAAVESASLYKEAVYDGFRAVRKKDTLTIHAHTAPATVARALLDVERILADNETQQMVALVQADADMLREALVALRGTPYWVHRMGDLNRLLDLLGYER